MPTKSQLFNIAGTYLFVPPANVSCVFVSGGGAGGGGGASTDTFIVSSGSGGGSGESCDNVLIPVTPLVGITVVIGAGGAGVLAPATDGGNGTVTSFGTQITLNPGFGGNSSAYSNQGVNTTHGGGVGGGTQPPNNNDRVGVVGVCEASTFWGGSSGGGSSSNTNPAGMHGGSMATYPGGLGGPLPPLGGDGRYHQRGSGGGASTRGAGGDGATGPTAGGDGQGPGAGGAGGGGTQSGGKGQDGWILVSWFQP